jgi:penicillin amidase
MEFTTHAAAGRVSELIGPGKDDAIWMYDRGQRRIGLVYAAEQALKAMQENETSRRVLDKYTEGINTYIASLNYCDYPLEYKLMDYAPEPWTPLKCALLLRSMAQTLNMGDKDMQMSNALKLYGLPTVSLLYPDVEPVGDPIVENPGGWNFKPVTIDSLPPAVPHDLIKIVGLTTPDPSIGSNNWAVSGSKTATGAPILCSDPHLTTNLPSIWFANQLQAPGINVMGASLPGAPGVIIGFNDSIAWGVTNAQRDLVDWYAITFKDRKTRDHYLLDGEWKETRKVVETFTVRGRGVVHDTVVYTHWGPVPYDASYRAENNRRHYAFRWLAHDASNEMMAFHLLNRAHNHSDYMEALNHFACPAQNFAFASVAGDVAMRIQGKFPVRRKGEGKFVLDGSKSSNSWQAFIPDEHNVMSKNPERGFISSANQYPADTTYPYYINATSYETYRNRRINRVLRSSSGITVEDMMRLQNDTYNIKAEESLPLFLIHLSGLPMSEPEKLALEKLKAWDYHHTAETEGASYYQEWLNQLMPMVWDELQRDNLSLSMPTTWNTLRLIKEQPDLPFFDLQSSADKREVAADVVILSFRKAVADLEAWKDRHQRSDVPWADYKDTYVEHLARLPQFSEHVKHGGNGSAVNASNRQHGPSWRMVVSLEKSGVRAFGVYPGGQSGNPGSIHYTNLLPLWASATYVPLTLLRNTEDAAHQARQKFNPIKP